MTSSYFSETMKTKFLEENKLVNGNMRCDVMPSFFCVPRQYVYQPSICIRGYVIAYWEYDKKWKLQMFDDQVFRNADVDILQFIVLAQKISNLLLNYIPDLIM